MIISGIVTRLWRGRQIPPPPLVGGPISGLPRATLGHPSEFGVEPDHREVEAPWTDDDIELVVPDRW